MILEHRAYDIALIILKSRAEGRIWDLCKCVVAGGKDGDLILEGKIGVYISILLGQKSSEFGDIFLAIEQICEVFWCILSECDGS